MREQSIEAASVVPADAAAAVAATADPVIMVRPRTVATALGVGTLLILAGGVASRVMGIADELLALDAEKNVPTYFSTMLLVSAAGLLALISVVQSRARDRYRFHWVGLALAFVYLSMDEFIGLHEIAGGRISGVVETSGPFFYSSTIATSTLVVLFAVSFWRFLLDLPARFRMLFASAAALYLGGALGLELVGGWYDERYGTAGAVYATITTLEEALEMSGIVLFLYALLVFLGTRTGPVQIRFGARGDG